MTKKVLIVDDNSFVRKALSIALKNEEFELHLADGYDSCIQTVKDGLQPDIILLDIMMPGKDGLQTAKTLKEMGTLKDTPLYFLTAKTDDYTKKDAESYATDFIEKPFKKETLLKLLHLEMD